MARQTHCPATCLHTTSLLYPFAPLFSPQLFFSPKITLIPPFPNLGPSPKHSMLSCVQSQNVLPCIPYKSHGDSTRLPNLQADPAEPLRLLIKRLSPRSWGLMISSDSPGISQVRGLISLTRLLGFPRLLLCLRASLCAWRQAF